MTTQPQLLPDLDAALDFDVPCEWCDRAAAWLGIMSCCGVDSPHCTHCATNQRVHISCMFSTPGLVVCAECGHELTSPRDIRWEPVR